MTDRTVGIAIPLQLDRHFPAARALDGARALESTGVVDFMHGWDQLCSRWPEFLWTRENTPWRDLRPDSGSLADWVTMLGAAAAVAPGLGVALSTDAIRRGPADWMQTMLTMANLTQGRAQFHFGAGEIKNTAPFGWKRSEGLRRQEDLFRIFKLFWENEGPIDFEGNIWKLKDAWLGSARQYKPKWCGLGGGPKIVDMSTSYADGFATLCRGVAYTPERWHEMVTTMKRQLEQKGRDPEDFEFGLYASMAIHDDDELIDTALRNPLLKWMVAIIGRVIMSDWDADGIEPPMPRDWHYSNKLIPLRMTRADADRLLDPVTDEMIEAAWLRGSPKEIATQLQAYVDAGATWISIIDLLPVVMDPAEAPAALSRTLEVASLLKGVPLQQSVTPAEEVAR